MHARGGSGWQQLHRDDLSASAGTEDPLRDLYDGDNNAIQRRDRDRFTGGYQLNRRGRQSRQRVLHRWRELIAAIPEPRQTRHHLGKWHRQ